MKGNKHQRSGERKFRRFIKQITIILIGIVLCYTMAISYIVTNTSSTALQNNASSLVAFNNKQLQININSYLNKVQTTAALLFSDEDYYEYDETTKDLSDYDKIQKEDNIVKRIVDLGIMENFSDFGIVYKDNYTVGWISKTTETHFAEGNMYESINEKITNKNTSDGWFCGVNSNYDRLYYTKRINDNALLIASFYSRELAHVFQFPDNLEGMVIRLVSEDNHILYSSTKSEIGKNLSKKIANHSKEYLVTEDICTNGWRVVCSVPTKTILKDTSRMRWLAFVTSAIMIIVVILLVIFVIWRSSKPMDSVVMDLQNKALTDGLSGLLNKISFEKHVSHTLSETEAGKNIAIIIMDVDHFKNINDTLGHSYGDKVIVRTSNVLRKTLGDGFTVGRIGGDEFAIFIPDRRSDLEAFHKYMEKTLQTITSEFMTEFAEEHKSCDLSVSLGCYVAAYQSESFADIYHLADSALYVSKETGRGKYTFYEEGMANE